MAINMTNLTFRETECELPMEGRCVVASVEGIIEPDEWMHIVVREGHDWVDQESGECYEESRVSGWAPVGDVYQIQVFNKETGDLLVNDFYDSLACAYEDWNVLRKPSVCGSEYFELHFYEMKGEEE